MMPVTWPNFSDIHPFAPIEQAQGYQVVGWLNVLTITLIQIDYHKYFCARKYWIEVVFPVSENANLDQEMFNNLGELLCTITGFDSFSLQPNAGAAGEYAGLMVIRAYHLVW